MKQGLPKREVVLAMLPGFAILAAGGLAVWLFNERKSMQPIDVTAIVPSDSYWHPIEELVKMYSPRDDFYPKPRLRWINDSQVVAEFDMGPPLFDQSIEWMHVEAFISQQKPGAQWTIQWARRRWTCKTSPDRWTIRSCV